MPTNPESDWYLRAWAERVGKRQSDMVRDLGMMKNSAHRIWHSKQPYRRDIVNVMAKWLGVRPYELLMPPEEALALRRIRESAQAIVAESEHRFDHSRSPPAGARKRSASRG